MGTDFEMNTILQTVPLSKNFISTIENVTIMIFMPFTIIVTLTCKINSMLHRQTTLLSFSTFIYRNDMSVVVVVLIQFSNQIAYDCMVMKGVYDIP